MSRMTIGRGREARDEFEGSGESGESRETVRERRSGRERRGQGDELAAKLAEAFREERRLGERRR